MNARDIAWNKRHLGATAVDGVRPERSSNSRQMRNDRSSDVESIGQSIAVRSAHSILGYALGRNAASSLQPPQATPSTEAGRGHASTRRAANVGVTGRT